MKRVLVAWFLAVGAGHLAFADLEFKLTDGTNTALIDSAGVLHLTGAASGVATAVGGVYTFNGVVGNYILNTTISEGSPFLPAGRLDMNTSDTSLGASGPLDIEWSENGITTVFNKWLMKWGATLLTGAGGNVSYTAYEDNTNAFFGTQNMIGQIGPLGSGIISKTRGGDVPVVTSTYSLSELVVLNGVGMTNYNGEPSLLPVPEPASMVLLGFMVLAIGLAQFRRSRLISRAS